jgi:hypothetical protein
VVLTPSNFYDQGQFSVNGQRPDANYFLVDGVSANLGTGYPPWPSPSLLCGCGMTIPQAKLPLTALDRLDEFHVFPGVDLGAVEYFHFA